MTVRIGVVGGGPSGCAAAVALCSAAEAHHSPVDVTVFEKQAPYKGRTFNTGDPVLLLNTSAGVTSVRAENPNDFVSFLATHRPTNPADFVARTEAAAYLQQTMNGLGGRFSRLRVRQMEVRCVEETPEADLAVRSEGSRFLFDALVLAMGAPFRTLETASAVRCVSPYPVCQLDDVEQDDAVLILGSHLSAIDACVWLHSKEHRGPITLLSRSGRLPAVRRSLLHSDAGRDAERAVVNAAARQGVKRLQCLAPVLAQQGGASMAKALNGSASFRDGADEFMAAWQESEAGPAPWERLMMFAIDALNTEWPLTPAAERGDFQQRIGARLGRFISAMPLRNARILAGMLATGQLRLAAGGLDQAGRPSFDDAPPPGAPNQFDVIINATGLGRPADDPFLAELARKRLVRINADGGVDVDAATGRVKSALPIYALGPVAQGAIYTPNFLYSSVRSAQGLKAILPRGVDSIRQHTEAA
ncbi:FAD/NAD(P)-binding protein [Azospirillum cavernae]|nr:FAD/NAD(P)-binding protein [Azospirillum cavernae]